MTRLVIIGAGITGAGLFAEAAAAGLEPLLLERGRPGEGTTAVSSGLLHGGLRYLPYDARVSEEMSLEAGALSARYPSLVRRQVFLWPVFRGGGWGLETVEALLERYDALAPARRALPHVRLSAAEALELEPRLRAQGLSGALSFDEWAVDAAGLARALVEEGQRAGGRLQTGARVAGFAADGGRLRAARLAGGGEVAGELFVNAAGPWAGEVAASAGAPEGLLTLRKGVHAVIPGAGLRYALIFPDERGRHLGLYPRGAEAWVGPTDDPYEGPPDAARPEEAELRRLSEALERALPGRPAGAARGAVGVRPLFRQSGALLSRDFRVHDHGAEGVANLVSVVGGKLTTFRPMARAALEAVTARLQGRPCRRAASRSALAEAARSAALLGAAWLRHHARGGGTRSGLACFRETYEG